ncbi:MAG TPA: M20/M25/M40 family metallo-hydrolase [Thermoleophilaceae bacterium]|nr:M20/M25/M40 family metallo-hydrolase [Thermoleophilaceae bacterium]
MSLPDSVRADVEALAAMDRASAREGERASAAWVAERLAATGAAAVRTQPFRYSPNWGMSQAAHMLAASTGRLPALAALVSMELDFSGRAQPLRRLLPRGEGANVIASVPAREAATSTVVLVAHHDAANTGLLWRSPFADSGAKPEGRPPMTLLTELAMAAMALGPRRLRLPARALLALGVGLSLDVYRGATVPGASDNATGVAAVLELARRLVAEPLAHTEVRLVLTGCEESGMGGMAAWMADQGGRLDPETTLVLGLDTLGAGEPMVCSAEGPLWRVAYRPEDLVLADKGAEAVGESAPRRFRIGGYTDPALARLAGLPTVSLLSLRGNVFNDYHLPSDTPEHVDWDSVDRCVKIAEGTVRSWARGR